MGRIKNFLNRIFGKNQKTLGEAEPKTQAVPLDFAPTAEAVPSDVEPMSEPEENMKDEFKEDLQKNTVQKDEMSFDETLDYFIQLQKLAPICKNPRGREKLGNMLREVFKKEHVEDKDGVYKRLFVSSAIFSAFGETPKFERNSITFNDDYPTIFDPSQTNTAPGHKKTKISVDKYDQLSEVTVVRSPYLYNTYPDEKDKPIQVAFSKSEHHYEKSGIEDERIEESCRYDDMEMEGEYYRAKPRLEFAYGGLDFPHSLPFDYPNYKATSARRQDGILAEVHVVGQEGSNKHVYLNDQYGVDDLTVTDKCIDAKNYTEMTDEQKEEFKSRATDAISKSKYKEALVDQTPGVGMEDIEKKKSRD